MVFYPTFEEMKDFNAYVTFMESVGAANYGIARVVPPQGFTPRRSGYDLNGPLGDFLVETPIEQQVTGTGGKFMVINIEKDTMTLRDFQILADKRKAPEKLKDDIPVRCFLFIL